MLYVKKKLEWCSCFKKEISKNLRKKSSPALSGQVPIFSTALSKWRSGSSRFFLYHFCYKNVIKFKMKRAPATLKKCALSVFTISSSRQSRETVPLTYALAIQILSRYDYMSLVNSTTVLSDSSFSTFWDEVNKFKRHQ